MYQMIAQIRTLLKEANSTVFYEQAPGKTSYPYIVFRCYKPGFDSGSRDDIVIEINVWDLSTDALTVENIADQIEIILRDNHLVTGNILSNIEAISRLSIEDPNPQIKRRELRFLAKTYFV